MLQCVLLWKRPLFSVNIFKLTPCWAPIHSILRNEGFPLLRFWQYLSKLFFHYNFKSIQCCISLTCGDTEWYMIILTTLTLFWAPKIGTDRASIPLTATLQLKYIMLFFSTSFIMINAVLWSYGKKNHLSGWIFSKLSLLGPLLTPYKEM